MICESWDHTAIIELLLECGRIALEAQRQSPWTLKRDGSLVTFADHEIERTLAGALDHPDKGTFVIGEETVANRDERYIQAALSETAWIVDPIDGTAPYAHALTYWGTSIGFARAGHIEHGAIFLPALGEMFVTVDSEVMWAEQVNVHAPADHVCLKRLLPRSLPFTRGGLVALGQRFLRTRPFPWPNPVVATGSAVHALTYLMLGRLMGCVGYMRLWDVAGVLPMLARTGIEARLADGMAMTTHIDSGAFILEPGAADRWAQRDHAAFGPPEVVSALLHDVLAGTSSGAAPGSGTGARLGSLHRP